VVEGEGLLDAVRGEFTLAEDATCVVDDDVEPVVAIADVRSDAADVGLGEQVAEDEVGRAG
jgi:hypothetical protein